MHNRINHGVEAAHSTSWKKRKKHCFGKTMSFLVSHGQWSKFFLFNFCKQTKLTFSNPYLESRWCPTTRSRAWTSDGTHAEMLSGFVFSSARRIPVTEAKTRFQLLGAQTPQERDYVLEIKTSTYRVKKLDVFRKIKPPTGSNHLKKKQRCGQICGAALFSNRGDFFPPSLSGWESEM